MQTQLWLTRLRSPPPTASLSPSLLQEFIRLAKRLLKDPVLGKELAANGKAYVNRLHSCEVERATYQCLIRDLEGAAEE